MFIFSKRISSLGLNYCKCFVRTQIYAIKQVMYVCMDVKQGIYLN